MTKLKIILQSNYFYFVLLIFIILYLFISIFVIKKNLNKYPIKEEYIGRIIEKNNNFIIIKSKEKILVKNVEELNLSYNDLIKVKGKTYYPKQNTIPNTFNYKKYLENKKITKIIYANDIKKIKPNKNILYRFKNYFNNKGANNKYLSLFILGDKSYLEKDIYNAYKNIGVAHLLAISGMHISLLIVILEKLFIFINKNKLSILIDIILLIYLFLISFLPSFLKVFIYHILKQINKKYDLNINKLKILFITFVIIILINPLYIFNIGLRYSFSSSLAIIFSEKYQVKNYFLNILIISFFINLFILPININLNYELNLILFLSNIILIPLISFIIYPLSLVSFIIPLFENIFNYFTFFMEKIVSLIDKISFLTIIFPKMNIFLIVVYYFILISFIYFNNKKLFSLLLVILFFYKLSFNIKSNLSVSYFDVGQGDSSLIKLSKNKTILIDTGGNKNFHITDNIILYLKSINITKINYLIITHGDFDHMGDATNLVENFKVDKVIFNCGNFNELEKDLIKVLNKNNIKYYSCVKNININNNKLYFLNNKDYDDENNNSSVIYTQFNNYKFLFMGDAGIKVEEDIIKKYNLQNIDVLKVGHHGSKTSSSKNFINNTNPKYSIISVGENNRYGHPNKEVLNILENSNIYRTDQKGSIILKIKNNQLKIENCN